MAVAAILAVVAAVGLFGGSSSPHIAAAAFVTTAAQRTLAQSTADVTLSGTVHVDGEDLAFGGNGQVDFGTNVMALNLGAHSANGSMTETELLVGGNLYLEVTADGHNLAAVTGGRHWIEIPFAQLGSQSVTNGSAGMSLSLLRQQGASVTSLGTSAVDGQTCRTAQKPLKDAYRRAALAGERLTKAAPPSGCPSSSQGAGAAR